MIESDNFTYWLSVHTRPGIMPNEINKQTGKYLYKLPDADLISIMYHGRDDLALIALKELKLRFQDELHSIEEANRDRSMNQGNNHADNWN